GLPQRHVREITTVFQIFDPTLSGYIDVASFEVMVRSLGFRMTRMEIVGMVESLWEDRQQERVDVSMAIAILAQRGYTQRSVEEEIAMYFRIYDHGNKGYIDLQDLQRVQQEVKQAEVDLQREMQSDFDRNGDKVIDFDEFRRILESIIS
ncbi:predicted protein, partial [Thalassiosira pseudonana CCMP1335]